MASASTARSDPPHCAGQGAASGSAPNSGRLSSRSSTCRAWRCRVRPRKAASPLRRPLPGRPTVAAVPYCRGAPWRGAGRRRTGSLPAHRIIAVQAPGWTTAAGGIECDPARGRYFVRRRTCRCAGDKRRPPRDGWNRRHDRAHPPEHGRLRSQPRRCGSRELWTAWSIPQARRLPARTDRFHVCRPWARTAVHWLYGSLVGSGGCLSVVPRSGVPGQGPAYAVQDQVKSVLEGALAVG